MINLSEDMSAEDWQLISSKLYNYNLELSKGLSTKPGNKISLVLKSERGEVIGGIACRAFYQSLSIDHLWVDEKYRRTGYGKQLV